MESFDQETHIAYDIWQVEDVIYRAGESGLQVTNEQAEDILYYMEQNRDANIGLNWDVMDIYIDRMLEKP